MVNERNEEMEKRLGMRRSFLTACLAGILMYLPVNLFGANETVPPAAEINADDVDLTRAALEKLVETRRIISKEEQDWALGKEMLNERIDIVRREIESLRGKITEAERNITETDKKRAEMADENEKRKLASAVLGDIINTFEERTKGLLKNLPDAIRERIRPLSQRLPENPNETKLSLSERFQNIVGILNEVNKFNREIQATSEVRTLPNGSSTEVTAMYVGISQAYYASAKGDAAGIGMSSAEGWTWTPDNKAAADISEAIAILKNEKVAEFVLLPIKIR